MSDCESMSLLFHAVAKVYVGDRQCEEGDHDGYPKEIVHDDRGTDARSRLTKISSQSGGALPVARRIPDAVAPTNDDQFASPPGWNDFRPRGWRFPFKH